MRFNATAFDFKQNCLFCGIFFDKKELLKHPNRGTAQFRRVMKTEFEETMKEHCAQRQDEWSALVESRILAAFDLYQQQMTYITLIVTKISGQENKFLPASSKKKFQ